MPSLQAISSRTGPAAALWEADALREADTALPKSRGPKLLNPSEACQLRLVELGGQPRSGTCARLELAWEQAYKALLKEVTILGQDLSDFHAAHDIHGNAVCQTVLLVWAFFVQRESSQE